MQSDLQSMMTLGSLFDGSGGFPLAGMVNGITPVWASEIEPYPLLVTRTRFPKMEHLGSVLDIDGSKIRPVGVVTFGSPCQDLSSAGKQAGIIEGKRSNLFFQAARVLREMRKATNGKYPRFATWENVPGAFSSSKGEDFRAVLSTLCSVAEGKTVSIPLPEKKWGGAGCIVGDGYSIAWKVYDAQYWPRTPQRRKRIYLIVDFGSECAGEILFEQESLRGYPETSKKAGQSATADATGCIAGGSDRGGAECRNCKSKKPIFSRGISGCRGSVEKVSANSGISGCHAFALDCRNLRSNGTVSGTLQAKNNGGQSLNYQNPVIYPDTARSLTARHDSSPCIDRGQNFVAFHLQQDPISSECVAPCIGAQRQATVGVFMGGQGSKAGSVAYNENVSPTLRAAESGSNRAPDVCYCVQGNVVDRPDNAKMNGIGCRADQSYTLNTVDRDAVCYCVQGNSIDRPVSSGCEGKGIRADGKSYTLNTRDKHAVVYDCRGNGDGNVVPTITGDHENRVTDYSSCAVFRVGAYGEYKNGEFGTLRGAGSDTGFGGETLAVCVGNGQLNQMSMAEQANTLDCMHDQQMVLTHPLVAGALCANSHPGGCTGQDTFNDMLPVLPSTKPNRRYIVRRLIPLECSRLQGFPDGWADVPTFEELSETEFDFWTKVRETYSAAYGKKYTPKSYRQMITWLNKLHTDSAEYKMWGNGIALPCATDVLRRIAKRIVQDYA